MHLPPPAELIERLRRLDAGHLLLERLPDSDAVYLVGGATRDLLLGTEPRELDLVVEGDAIALAEGLGGQVLAHDRFLTCTVRLEGHTFDIASARRESYERPGALPAVSPAPLSEDLRRRDFTVNAIAMALRGPRAGVLTAAEGAPQDLQARILRVLHDGSFRDDPTRLLRLARYAARLRFEIDPRTRDLALDAAGAGALATVSGARVGSELRLLAREDDPVAAFAALRELRIDAAVHPRFGLPGPDPLQTALALLPPDGFRELLVLAVAGREIRREELLALLDRLAFEAHDRGRIVAAATGAGSLAQALAHARRPSEIAAAAGAAPPEQVALAGALGAERAATAWLNELRHVRLEIDGSDLIAAGVPRGPLVGRGLEAALAAKLDGRASGREAELEQALAAVR